MIDVWSVAANAVWIVGLAVLLATFSWAHWVASVEKDRFRAVLRRARLQRAMDVGLALFCAGLAATSGAWWKRVLWGVLTAAWVFQAWAAGRG